MHKDFSRKKKFLTNLIDVDRLEENLINSSNSDELTNENFYSEKSDHVESIVDNFVFNWFSSSLTAWLIAGWDIWRVLDDSEKLFVFATV